MKDIMNKIWKVVIVIILIIGICISVYRWIVSLFEERDLLTKEEIVVHEVPSKLLKDYATYYFVEDCIENIIEGCSKSLYSELYKLYMKDYRKGYSKDEIISVLRTTFNTESGTDFVVKGIYNVEDIGILAIITMNNQDINILFNLNEKEGAAYYFALIK